MIIVDPLKRIVAFLQELVNINCFGLLNFKYLWVIASQYLFGNESEVSPTIKEAQLEKIEENEPADITLIGITLLSIN